MSTFYVGPEGPLTAKLAIVGEKPGYEEVRLGRPFVGATGRMLDRYLARIGLRRDEVYLTNAVKHLNAVGNPTIDEVKSEQRPLFRELDALPNLGCTVALGNVALVSLSNFHYSGIEQRRGSRIKTFTGKKMIPTYHPAYIARGQWALSSVVEFDLRRAKEEALKGPTLKLPERSLYVMPTFEEALEWLDLCTSGQWLSFDIETRKCGPFSNWYLTTIAFSPDERVAFCIPFAKQDRSNYWDKAQEIILWRRIQDLLAMQSKRYVTQNGLFDCWNLLRNGIRCPYMANGFDTMYAHRYLAPDLPHALHFLSSIYTDEPYYKDESGTHESEVRVSDEQFQAYNCKDAAVTLEVAKELIKELNELGMYDFYMAEKQSQFDVLLEMRERGIHVDKQRLSNIRSKLLGIVTSAEGALDRELGWVPNTKSFIDMGKLFDQLGVKYTTTKTGRPETSEDRLLTYANTNPQARDALSRCVEITQQRTLLSGFLRLTLDSAGFYHPSYDLSHAKSGRLSSSGADEGVFLKKDQKAGPQLQNQPKSVRYMYVPDEEGDELSNYDYKQAEPHYVAWDAEDHFYINALTSGKDVHRIAGCVLFRDWDIRRGLPPPDLVASIRTVCDSCERGGEKECVHSERYLSKKCKHAFAYKMGVNKLLIVLASEGIFISKQEAERIRSRSNTPAVLAWQDKTNYHLTKKSRWLESAFGGKREFYGLPDEDMLREALSWKPQFFVSVMTCRAMVALRPALAPLGARVVTQGHDSILVNHHKKDREEVDYLVARAMRQPVIIHGRELVVPIESSHGPSWGEQHGG